MENHNTEEQKYRLVSNQNCHSTSMFSFLLDEISTLQTKKKFF